MRRSSKWLARSHRHRRTPRRLRRSHRWRPDRCSDQRLAHHPPCRATVGAPSRRFRHRAIGSGSTRSRRPSIAKPTSQSPFPRRVALRKAQDRPTDRDRPVPQTARQAERDQAPTTARAAGQQMPRSHMAAVPACENLRGGIDVQRLPCVTVQGEVSEPCFDTVAIDQVPRASSPRVLWAAAVCATATSAAPMAVKGRTRSERAADVHDDSPISFVRCDDLLRRHETPRRFPAWFARAQRRCHRLAHPFRSQSSSIV